MLSIGRIGEFLCKIHTSKCYRIYGKTLMSTKKTSWPEFLRRKCLFINPTKQHLTNSSLAKRATEYMWLYGLRLVLLSFI